MREARVGRNGAVVVRLEIPPDPPGPKPALLANLNEGDTLMPEGVVIVSYKVFWAFLKDEPQRTPPPAGEATVGKFVLASASAAELGRPYLENVVDTGTEVIPLVVDYLLTQPEIDPRRIGISGASTNGFMALQALAADPRISVGVVVAACGDYLEFLRSSGMGMEGRPLELDPAYESWIRDVQPDRRPDRFLHAAIALVARTGDPVIPISCVDGTARLLEKTFARAKRADRFRYVRLDQAGHGLGPDEGAAALAWLRQWLLGRPTTALP